MNKVVISQPMYFPWVGFIGHLTLADTIIWLDDAQFSKGSFTNRVQVKGARGPNWMTVTLKGKGSFQQIADLSAAEPQWPAAHRELLRQQLKGAPFLGQALRLFEAAVQEGPLVETLIRSSEVCAEFLNGLPQKQLRSSELNVGGKASERVLALVRAVGGTHYITGHGASNYLDHPLLENAGIEVSYMKYDIPPWPQFHPPFNPYVTSLDGIAHCGKSLADHLPRSTIGWREFLAGRDRES